MRPDEQISVLAVDDNEQVLQAVQLKLSLSGGFRWKGGLQSADRLHEMVEALHPDIVLLDIDMPGRDPFDALGEISVRWPKTRVVVFSGRVRKELVDRAIEAGTWGYISKGDGEGALIGAIRAVAEGHFVLSPEVRATYGNS